MRITKLHLLLIFLILGVGLYAFYFLHVKQMEIQEAEEKIKIEMAELKRAQDQFAKKVAEAKEAQARFEETLKEETADEAAAPDIPKRLEPVTYTVRRGDTLWSIAKMKKHFGLGHRWYDIWKANEKVIFDFDRIVRGQVITIPLDKPENYPWPKTSEERKRKILDASSGSQRRHSGNVKTN